MFIRIFTLFAIHKYHRLQEILNYWIIIILKKYFSTPFILTEIKTELKKSNGNCSSPTRKYQDEDIEKRGLLSASE